MSEYDEKITYTPTRIILTDLKKELEESCREADRELQKILLKRTIRTGRKISLRTNAKN